MKSVYSAVRTVSLNKAGCASYLKGQSKWQEQFWEQQFNSSAYSNIKMYNATGGNNFSVFVVWLNVHNSYKNEKTVPFLKIFRRCMVSFKYYKGWQSNLRKIVLNLEYRRPESF